MAVLSTTAARHDFLLDNATAAEQHQLMQQLLNTLQQHAADRGLPLTREFMRTQHAEITAGMSTWMRQVDARHRHHLDSIYGAYQAEGIVESLCHEGENAEKVWGS